MAETASDQKTRQQERIGAPGTASPVVPISTASQVRRRRFIRILFTVMTAGGIGLSAVPRGIYATGSAATTTTTSGVMTEVQKFTYRRDHGVPFRTVSVHFGDNGEITRFIIEGTDMVGLMGNMLVAGALVIGVSLLRRRRRAG